MVSKRYPIVLLLLFWVFSARSESPGVWAFTGGTVHPVSGPEIARGVVIVRDGLIESIGANVTPPADATIVDVTGAHVYPGLIDAQTSLGFVVPRARPQGGGAPSAAPREERAPETSAESLALSNLKLTDDDADARRSAGVTTILTVPSSGVFNGQSVVLNLGGGTLESRVIKSPATQQISFNTRAGFFGGFPNSLMGVVAHIRQSLLDAQQHSAAFSIYERTPAGTRRPAQSPSLDALGKALRRELPVVFMADSASMMRRALSLSREFNLRPVLSGARQGYKMAGELKDVPVLVSVRWPVAPANDEDSREQPLRIVRDRALSPTTPAVLAKAGVTFALVSGAAKSSEFIPGIRKAIDNGLSADDALRAVTLVPARILGIDRQLGSLERGKIANLIVTDKPIFVKEAKVKRVFVDGREIRLPADDKDAKKDEGQASTPLDGTWSLTVKTTQGDVAIQATFSVEGGRVSGSFSGDRGSGEIRGGAFDGTTLEFSISITSEQSEASDWSFRGTLSDSSLEGTVSSNLGTFPFRGSKSQ